MTEVDYGYHKCSNCGKEDFQWGVIVTKEIFICEFCVQVIAEKIDDRKKEAQNTPHYHKTFSTEHDTVPLKTQKFKEFPQ